MRSVELDSELSPEQQSSPLEFSRNVDPFPVLDKNGTAYHTPFSGGFNVPRPQFVDIDGDSDLDLFLQEQTDKLTFFENIGNSKEPIYSWNTDHYHDIPIGEWSRFFDFDSDGDLDLLTEEPFSYIANISGTSEQLRPQLSSQSVILLEIYRMHLFLQIDKISPVLMTLIATATGTFSLGE